MDEAEQLEHLLTELAARGYSPVVPADVDLAAAWQMLGMDPSQPWHAVRVRFRETESEDGIRGRDAAEALANARWNWPTAVGFVYLGPAS